MNVIKFVQNYYLEYVRSKSIESEIYYIEIKSNVAGFFALLRNVLDYCCYAEENGFRPYIKYGREILYSEKNLFMGTSNPFEYYFEQPMILKPLSFFRGINIVKCQVVHIDEIELKYNLKSFSYLVEDTYITRMAEVYGKYIKLNVKIRGKIEESVKKLLKGKKTLGIHIRGTDFYKEFNNHPVPVTVNEYIKIIEKVIVKYQFEQIFVATDDGNCLDELRKNISIPLVYYKTAMRATGKKSVVFEKNERKHNNYFLGFEVLRDVYTLSACDGFLGCLSQIDIFVQIIKKSRKQEFSFLKIINKGIYSNNRQCWEPKK